MLFLTITTSYLYSQTKDTNQFKNITSVEFTLGVLKPGWYKDFSDHYFSTGIEYRLNKFSYLYAQLSYVSLYRATDDFGNKFKNYNDVLVDYRYDAGFLSSHSPEVLLMLHTVFKYLVVVKLEISLYTCQVSFMQLDEYVLICMSS